MDQPLGLAFHLDGTAVIPTPDSPPTPSQEIPAADLRPVDDPDKCPDCQRRLRTCICSPPPTPPLADDGDDESDANDGESTVNDDESTANDDESAANDSEQAANDDDRAANDNAQATSGNGDANDSEQAANDDEQAANDDEQAANDDDQAANDNAQATNDNAQATNGNGDAAKESNPVDLLPQVVSSAETHDADNGIWKNVDDGHEHPYEYQVFFKRHTAKPNLAGQDRRKREMPWLRKRKDLYSKRMSKRRYRFYDPGWEAGFE